MGIVSKVRNFACLLSGHGVELGRQAWDREYQQGQWQYLHGLDQRPRYSVIVGYLLYFKPGAAVLDVGCGEGILQRMLAPAGYRRYVGIDFSGPAIQTARSGAEPRCTFHECDAATWQPTESFDAIIFNEALYYFRDPPDMLHKYEKALKADGIFVVSMYWRAGNTGRIWSKIDRHYACLHQTKLTCGPAQSWVIKVLSRRGAGVEG